MKLSLKKYINPKMLTLLGLLALVVVVFTIASKGDFIKPKNISTVLDQMFVTAMLTIGAGMLLISGQLDLSTGVVGTMAGTMFAYSMNNWHIHWVPSIILTLLVATIIGVINAALINELKFSGFIATLAMAAVVEGATYLFSGGLTIPVNDKVVLFIGQGKLFDSIPISVVMLFIAFIFYGLALSRSKFGRYVYLVGGNQTASRLAGVNTKKVSYALFINSSVLGALAGILLAARVSSATPTGIKASQFAGITAAILGGISFGGGAGGMGGAFVGLLILTAFTNGMLVLHFDPYWRQVISGAILLLALTFDYISNRRSMKKLGQ